MTTLGFWNITQSLIWICNAKGDFAGPGEIRQLIATYDWKDKPDPAMFVGLMRMLHLPKVQQADRADCLDGNGNDVPGAEVGKRLSKCFAEAQSELVSAIRDGSIELRGRPLPSRGEFEILNRHHCARITISDDDGPSGPPHAIYRDNPDFAWDMLRLESNEIVARWPLASAKPAAKHPGGAPAKYPWGEIEAALKKECELQEGMPGPTHSDSDWRTHADAYRFIRERFNWKNGGPSDASMKARVGLMLRRIAASFGEVNN